MARKNSQARQAACRICGKDWQISALAVIPPSGYELREIIKRAFTPVLDWLTELAGKIVKIVRDAVDRIWCNDRHWWYMAEHHKKRRIRKKYRTKIKRMARDRARKLLHSLGCDTQEEQDDTEASDDEEVP